MVRGIPCKRTTSLKNNSTICEASSLLWHGIICAILLNRSTTTKIESLPYLVSGKPRTKFMDMSSQGTLGTGSGVYKPWGFKRDLALWHNSHQRTCRSTSLLILGQKKWSKSTCFVFLAPKWPISPPAWASCKSKIRTKHSAMQSVGGLRPPKVLKNVI